MPQLANYWQTHPTFNSTIGRQMGIVCWDEYDCVLRH